jgi:hypothetical protein
MKHARLFGLYAGCAWGAYIVVRSAMIPTREIMGEGEYIFLIAAAPLILIAIFHSLFISIPSRIPAYYAGTVAAILIALFLVYRLHLGFTQHDLRSALLTPVVAAALFLACSTVFYAVPGLKWIYLRLSKTSNQSLQPTAGHSDD